MELPAEIERVLISTEQIAAKVKELGLQISRDYEGKQPIVVGVLRGAVVFLSDLIRTITIPMTIDFVAISSYGQLSHSSGEVRILKDLDQSVENRHVLIVEDIIDTGLTLEYLLEMLHAREVASVRVVALVDKPSRRKTEVRADYLGFEIPDAFVVGYGLDYGQCYRHLPYIGVLKSEVYGGGGGPAQEI